MPKKQSAQQPRPAPTPSLAKAVVDSMVSNLEKSVVDQMAATVIGVQMKDGSWQFHHAGQLLGQFGLLGAMSASLARLQGQ